MLKVKNVTKYYGDFKAVDNLSFEVKPGEIFGLLGVNGAGKTTTFRMIMGLLDMTEGSITLDGKKIDYDVTDEIGILKGMKEEEIIKRTKELLEKFEIPEYFDKKIKELSKGNQQKVQFITAIINNPKLLILDEPFSGLDPFNVELFKKQIVEMSEKGSMIIFSSHRMEHVELFCKKLVVLLNGKAVLEGELKKIKEQYRKKNILIKGDIDPDKVKKIKGVISVVDKADEYEVKIEDEKIVEDVFKYVTKCDNITKFSVEEPSLNEIFVAKVGESYEK